MSTIFCFGELLLRMSPALHGQWIETAQMPIYVGGAELNVATALATWNMPVKYCTALPDNYLSKEIITILKSKNIDTTPICFCGERVGLYFLPQGSDLKNAGVIYDRANSSFANLKPGMINWDKVLEGCNWFHFSAISPALNDEIAAVFREALQVASAKGITISVDLNYRAKLWQYGKQPKEVMPELLQYCDVVMGNIWAAESLLGLPLCLDDRNETNKEVLIAAAENNLKHLLNSFPEIKTVAYTFRFDDVYFSVLHKENKLTTSQLFPVNKVVDKVGSGDCFMAGIIYGLQNKLTPQKIIDVASLAAVGKMSVKGDATTETMEMIQTKLIHYARK
jgi:2-dehydro-3-deoxygluconokinase